MVKKIGGEFWEFTSLNQMGNYIKNWFGTDYSKRFLASGRTAINHIICDILANNTLKIIYMPSYCCQTMITPFLSNGINVKFYDITINKENGFDYNIDYNTNCDAILVMSYFGFYEPKIAEITEIFKRNRKIIIEDATHSLFLKNANSPNSDYIFASFRKWTAIPDGAMVSKRNEPFYIKEPTKRHLSFVEKRIDALNKKADFMKGINFNENSYLKAFQDAEDLLNNDYKDYKMDELTIPILNELNTGEIITKRISNARILINGLSKNPNLDLIYKNVDDNDCPLFLPAIIKNGMRDELKRHLIKNEIYCPSHWPKSEIHKLNDAAGYLYDTELSIVCDQRYDSEDMQRIIKVINNFRWQETKIG